MGYKNVHQNFRLNNFNQEKTHMIIDCLHALLQKSLKCMFARMCMFIQMYVATSVKVVDYTFNIGLLGSI